ncbi:MAG: PDR/VanB family oxidoreductase [Planktotalea sp.]|uniref:PDR/VanB family oxidoreductase n=1 Tax=Planktotalea sp. TaxID=2029877 RepID=UPI003C796E8A
MTTIQGKIIAVTPLSERITALRIAALDSNPLPAFDAGAHIAVSLPNGETRAYSLICLDGSNAAPLEYQIAVQREDNGQGGSRFMHQLSVGDALTFGTPKNDFPVDTNQPARLVAGGIGVTPMISMASALKAAGQDVSMIFAGRSKGDMAFRDELAALLGDALTLHCDDESGLLDLDKALVDLGAAHLYVCGPRAMLDAVRAKAQSAGIAADHIHFELFEAAAPEAGDSPFEVQINDGSIFTIPAGKSIIEVLEENDVDVMYDCQRGDCGICQCDVLDGVPDHRDVVLSEAERAAGDVMQICVSRSKTPRLVLDI